MKWLFNALSHWRRPARPAAAETSEILFSDLVVAIPEVPKNFGCIEGWSDQFFAVYLQGVRQRSGRYEVNAYPVWGELARQDGALALRYAIPVHHPGLNFAQPLDMFFPSFSSQREAVDFIAERNHLDLPNLAAFRFGQGCTLFRHKMPAVWRDCDSLLRPFPTRLNVFGHIKPGSSSPSAKGDVYAFTK